MFLFSLQHFVHTNTLPTLASVRMYLVKLPRLDVCEVLVLLEDVNHADDGVRR